MYVCIYIYIYIYIYIHDMILGSQIIINYSVSCIVEKMAEKLNPETRNALKPESK